MEELIELLDQADKKLREKMGKPFSGLVERDAVEKTRNLIQRALTILLLVPK